MVVRRSTLRLTPLVIVVVACILFSPLLVGPAAAAPEVTASSDASLTLQGVPAMVRLECSLGGTWPDAEATVEVRGPGAPTAGAAGWPLVSTARQSLGDLEDGTVTSVVVPAEAFPEPGGYHLTVTVASGADKRVSDTLWVGRVQASPDDVELAIVFPVMVGIHRDPSGVFVDQVVQQSVAPDSGAPGSLYALFDLAESFPAWRMTWSVEPFLLSQLEDLADGFDEVDAGGTTVSIEKGAGVAAEAAQAIDTFRVVAKLDSLQLVPTPFASPHLSLVVGEGWDDAFDQVQLGKAEFQSMLQIPVAPDGMVPPGLDVTTDSIGVFSSASIDYVLADAQVAADLAETPSGLSRAVRVRDQENARLTLLFVDEELRTAMGPPWEADRFAAAFAARLAEGAQGPFVVYPAQEYGWPPSDYLRGLGTMLARAPWVETRTLDDLLDAHPPDSRPLFLSRYGGPPEGFVAEAYVEALRRAQASAADLEGATDSDRAPLDQLRLWLMLAESYYWFVAGVDPRVANLGLSYVQSSAALVAGEFDKVDVAGDTSVTIFGREGEIPVAIVNRTGYPLDVRLTLSGEGVRFGGEADTVVTLQPQENVFTFPARFSGGRSVVEVKLAAGGTPVDAATIRVRSISVGTVVPWAAGAVLLVVLSVVVVRRRRV